MDVVENTDTDTDIVAVFGGLAGNRNKDGIRMVTSTIRFLWYNRSMPKHLVPVMSLLAAVILLVMLNFTTPAGVGPFGVLVFFTTFYVLMFGIALVLVRFFARLARAQLGKKEYAYGAVVAFGPIMLMLAQSMGSMSLLTVGLTVLFVVLGLFLVSKK